MASKNIQDLMRIALEEVAEEITPEEVQAITAELDEAVQDIAEVQEKVEELQDDIAEMGVVSDSLESYVERLTASLENGGLDAQAARFLSIGVESLYKRLDMNEETKGIPSVEAFGGTADRVTSTQIALESISEKLKTIWLAIKAGVAKAWEMLQAFFGRIFASTSSVAKRATALAAAAGKAKGKAEGKLAVPASLEAEGSISAGLKKSAAIVDAVFKQTESEGAKYFDALTAGATALVNGKSEAVADPEFKAVDGELIGGYKVSVDGGTLAVSAGSGKAAESDVPAIGEIKAIAEAAAAVAKSLDTNKATLNGLKAKSTEFIKAMDTVIKSTGKPVHGKFIDAAAARVLAAKGRRNLTGASAKVSSIALKAANTALAYGEKALRAYKEEASA